MILRMRVLVVEDDPILAHGLTQTLRREGYVADNVPTAEGADAALRVTDVDLVILDIGLPGVDGFAWLKRLRARGEEQSVLVLTAREAVTDRVHGLNAGADDYLAKPFDLDELLARLRALLRRTKSDDSPNSEAVQLADLRLDPTSRRVWRGEREIELSKTEFDLLELLLRNQGIVLDHSTIYDRIWGYDFGPDSKNLAVYISYLRRKLELPGESKLIHTVRGVGYSARSS